MTVTALPDTAPEVTAAPDVGGGDDAVHITCCDPDTAVCGVDVTDQPYVDAPVDCWDCALRCLQDRPCTVRFCRLRRAWRDFRGRFRR